MNPLPRAYYVVLLAAAIVVLVTAALLDGLVLAAGHNVSLWQGIGAPGVGVVTILVARRGLRCQRGPRRWVAVKRPELPGQDERMSHD